MYMRDVMLQRVQELEISEKAAKESMDALQQSMKTIELEKYATIEALIVFDKRVSLDIQDSIDLQSVCPSGSITVMPGEGATASVKVMEGVISIGPKYVGDGYKVKEINIKSPAEEALEEVESLPNEIFIPGDTSSISYKIRKCIVDILKSSNGLSFYEIRDRLVNEHDARLYPSALQVHLSFLKKNGVIDCENRSWKLKEKCNA